MHNRPQVSHTTATVPTAPHSLNDSPANPAKNSAPHATHNYDVFSAPTYRPEPIHHNKPKGDDQLASTTPQSSAKDTTARLAQWLAAGNATTTADAGKTVATSVVQHAAMNIFSTDLFPKHSKVTPQ